MFVNLTPHDVVLCDAEGNTIWKFPPCGSVARVAVTVEPAPVLAGLPTVRHVYGPVEDLPEPGTGDIFIVSSLVLSQCDGRDDVIAPDTSPESAVRDDRGRIIGVQRFVRAPA